MTPRKRRIVHLVNDQKFIDQAYRLFEQVAPGENEFHVFTRSAKLRYIREAPTKRFNSISLFLYRFLPVLMPRPDILVVHGLNRFMTRYLGYFRRRCVVIWIGMGFDYYDLLGTGLYKPLTSEVRSRIVEDRKRTRLSRLFEAVIYGKLDKHKVIQRIDYFAPVLPDEYTSLRRRYEDFHPQFVSWNYNMAFSALERQFSHSRVSGRDILVGNSGTYENNHLEAFDLIRQAGVADRNIVVPLSYGQRDYVGEIVSHGKKQFGGRFVPLTEFMPLEEYIHTITRCSQVIMNHRRQQAMGNIIIMLYLGARVYLDRENVLYEFLSREGVFVYSLEEFSDEPGVILSDAEIAHNRGILARHFSDQVILDKTRILLTATRG